MEVPRAPVSATGNMVDRGVQTQPVTFAVTVGTEMIAPSGPNVVGHGVTGLNMLGEDGRWRRRFTVERDAASEVAESEEEVEAVHSRDESPEDEGEDEDEDDQFEGFSD